MLKRIINALILMTMNLMHSLQLRLDQAQYNVACDVEACIYYGLQQKTLSDRVWKTRRVVVGFFANPYPKACQRQSGVVHGQL